MPNEEHSMTEPSPRDPYWLADAFAQYRERLLRLVQWRLHPALTKRFSPDDLMQEIYLAAEKRRDYFQNRPDVPPYVQWRTLALQTLADMERRHLSTQKRDAMKEFDLEEDGDSGNAALWERFADSVTSPRTRLANRERCALTRRALASLSEDDRAILQLRHFEDLGNAECAAVLGIEPKAASIRYVRALKRFQAVIADISSLRP